MEVKKPTSNNKVTSEQIEELAITFLKGGFTLRQAKDISEHDMEAVYSIGFNFYNNGKYKEAIRLFSFLTLFDHYNKKYWIALGCARQMNKEYDFALRAFITANMLDIKDPIPFMRMAESLITLGNAQLAERALNEAIALFGENPKYKSDKEQAVALISFLQQGDK